MRPALSRATGVGVYLLNLVRTLAELDRENRYHLFSTSWSERFDRTGYPDNFRVHDHRWPGQWLHFSWNRLSYPPIEMLLRTSIDVAHSPSPLLIPSRDAYCVTTVHDLYFYFHPEQTSREIRRDYAALLEKHCRLSDAIIAVSEYTRQQLIDHLKIPASRIYTIRHGADPFFAQPVPPHERERVMKKFGLQRPFFLFVGTQEPRKNLVRLVEAFRNVNLECDLVLVGPAGWQPPDPAILQDSRIRTTGYISADDLRGLYSSAVALVMPSVEEGFGIPLLEAMAAGTPIVASNLPVFHEIAQDAFLSAEMQQDGGLEEALRKIYDDSGLRRSLTEKGNERIKRFSWQDAARKTLELYENL